MTEIDRPAMDIASAFNADAVQDPDGVAVRRCPACPTGMAILIEQPGALWASCSSGCTADDITIALHRAQHPPTNPGDTP